MALAYYRVGLILQQWNQPEQSVEQFKLAQQVYLSLPQQRSLSSVQSLPSRSGRQLIGGTDYHLSDRDFAYMFYASGLAYIQLDQLGHAIEAFDRVVEVNRHAVHKVDEWILANTYYELGRIYALQNRHIKAIETYPKALIAKPNHLATRYHLGLSYYALRKFQDAIETYETILLMVPLDCQLLLESCDMMGLTSMALETPQQSGANQLLLLNLQSSTIVQQRANIDRQFVRTYLPLTYRQLGTTYEAYSVQDALNTTLWLKDDAINYYKAGLTYETQGKYDQAHSAYNVVVRIYKELAEIEKAMLATESEARFEEFVRLFAVEAHLQSGNLHRVQSERTRALEDYHAALKAYQSALQLEPQRIEALMQRGNMHTRKREWEDAMTQYQNALAVEEQALATLYYRQGRSYQARQKNDEALTAYNEALKSRKLPIVYAQLGRVYMSQENPKTALENFDEALKLIPLQKGDLLLEKQVQPYEVQAHALSGDVYFDSGSAKEMQKQFHSAIAFFSNAGHEYFEAAETIRKLGGTSVDFNQMGELLDQASVSYKKVLVIGQYRTYLSDKIESKS